MAPITDNPYVDGVSLKATNLWEHILISFEPGHIVSMHLEA